jgi:hypothetical protein
MQLIDQWVVLHAIIAVDVGITRNHGSKMPGQYRDVFPVRPTYLLGPLPVEPILEQSFLSLEYI